MFNIRIVIILIVGMLLLQSNEAISAPVDESSLKAQWINDLIPYIKWKNRPYNEITVCVVGRETVNTRLEQIVKAEERETKKLGQEFSPIYIKRKETGSKKNFKECHILYISTSEQGNLNSILNDIKSLQILTISSLNNFAINGGVIGFVISHDGLKLQINEKVSHDSNILIDSDLLGFTETFWGRP